jgi:lysophospholipase L1-like esterase
MRKLGAFITFLVISGCGAASTPTEPTPGSSSAVVFTAIGASDAIGYGGSVVCLPFSSCPDGTGYIQRMARRFQADGKTVSMTNLGIPGAVLSPEIEALGNSLGRSPVGNFIQREMPFVPRDSTLVTVFAGGNDANTIGAAIEAGLGSPNPSAYAATQAQNFGRDMRELIAGIKDRAPSARIVVLNLPNLAGLPYAAGYSSARRQYLQQVAVGISAEINALTSMGVHVIDLMCNQTFYQGGSFSSDGFHPNDNGYAYLADLVYPVAAGAAAGPPRASCGQMTLF